MPCAVSGISPTRSKIIALAASLPTRQWSRVISSTSKRARLAQVHSWMCRRYPNPMAGHDAFIERLNLIAATRAGARPHSQGCAAQRPVSKAEANLLSLPKLRRVKDRCGVADALWRLGCSGATATAAAVFAGWQVLRHDPDPAHMIAKVSARLLGKRLNLLYQRGPFGVELGARLNGVGSVG